MLTVLRSTAGCLISRGLHTSRALLNAVDAGVQQQIADIVKHNKVVVFMKGVRDEPKCGFSNAVVQIMRMHGVDEYQDVDVLQDEKLRQGIKDFTKWPTIPQVFVNGEFVGGCDIMIQMHRSGEFMEVLRKAGIDSKIPDPPSPNSNDGPDESSSKSESKK